MYFNTPHHTDQDILSPQDGPGAVNSIAPLTTPADKPHESLSYPAGTTLYSVADIAHLLDLKLQRSNGSQEWHGPNPEGNGATRDGFILFQDGNAWDRKTDCCYTRAQVAELAGISASQYEPFLNARRNLLNSKAHKPNNNKNSEIDQNAAAKVSNERSLKERGIRQETLDSFQIVEKMRGDVNGWSYPTFHADGTQGRGRWKAADSISKPKYSWDGRPADPRPAGYNLEKIKGSTEVYLVGGEIDVWTAHQARIPAVSTFGEGQGHRELMAELKRLGVDRVHIVLDNDKAGHTGSIKAMEAAQAAGLDYTLRMLNGFDGFDVNDLYDRVGFSDRALLHSMSSLPEANHQTIGEWRSSDSNSQPKPIEVSKPNDAFNSFISSPSWPKPDPVVFYGLAGDIVRAIEPHTEADPLALLTQLFAAFGNAAGRSAHFVAEADRHYLNLFMVQVGVSAKGRKGTSWGHIRELFRVADPDWVNKGHVVSGLSSGEGMIYAVRDPVEKLERGKGDDGNTTCELVVVDEGITDKRLFVIEGEFASILRILGREGSTLSALIRQAWDTGDLQTLTKNSPAKATGAHISIVGHITKDELLRYLNSTEAGNGFANRFLWVCARRSKFLPEGGNIQAVNFAPLLARLTKATEYAQTVGEMRRDPEARTLWHTVYPQLSEGKPGLLGSVTARAEAQVMRLACIYALLDCSHIIRKEHLCAALALWDYCEASAQFIFGNSLGNPVADAILHALRGSMPNGLTQTEIVNLFSRNAKAAQIRGALGVLVDAGLARRERQATAERGRPTEMWFATSNESNPESPRPKPVDSHEINEYYKTNQPLNADPHVNLVSFVDEIEVRI